MTNPLNLSCKHAELVACKSEKQRYADEISFIETILPIEVRISHLNLHWERVRNHMDQ